MLAQSNVLQEAVLQDWPSALDTNHLHGHDSIHRHTLRWSAEAYFQGTFREVIVNELPKLVPPTLYIEERQSCIYIVMSAGRSSRDQMCPQEVSVAEGRRALDFIMLPLAEDRHEAWMLREGFLKIDSGHARIASTEWTTFYDRFCVVRFARQGFPDNWQMATHEQWLDAVTCVTSCDEYINHQSCEHTAVMRSVLGDPCADIEITPVTAEMDQGGCRPEMHRLCA
jgi:hypothetical protein